MSRKILGLDIRNDAVSAVLVRGGIKGNWIEDHRYIPLSGNDADALAEALTLIVSEMDVAAATCVAAFPSEDASYRNLNAPFKEKRKLRQILPFELESSLPYPPDDVVIDFNVLDYHGETEDQMVLTAAVQKEKVGRYLDVLKSNGIEPEILTTGGFSQAMAVSHFANDEENRILVVMEPDRVNLFLILRGQVFLARSFSTKVTTGAGVKRLCARIQQTLSGFQKKTGLKIEISEVVLSGPLLKDPLIEEEINANLNLTIRSLDLIDMSGLVSIETQGMQWDVTHMDASLALALVEIIGFNPLNFRQGSYAVEKQWVEYKKDIIKTGLLALVVLVVVFFSYASDYFSMKKRAVRLESEIENIFTSTFPDVKRIVDPLQQMRVKLNDAKTADSFSGEISRSVLAIDILNDISRYIPGQTDVELISIIIGADNVLISGNTGGFDAVDDVKNGLERAALFKSVAITSTNKDRTGNRVRFKIKAVI